MLQRKIQASPRRLAHAGRLFWATMLLMHLGALRAEWASLAAVSSHCGWGTTLLRALALTAAAAFFSLKIADVGWLRLCPGWRSLVASLLVIGLIHLNVLQRITRFDSANNTVPLGIVLFAGTLLESDQLRRILTKIPSIIKPALRLSTHPCRFACGLTGPAWEQIFKPHVVRITTHSVALRAPPLHPPIVSSAL